jgi:hypothetical protein
MEERKGALASELGSDVTEVAAEPRPVVREDPETLRADALVAMAEAAMAGLEAGSGRARVPEVVVHIDAAVLTGDAEGRSELDNGQPLAPETIRRLACDAGVVAMIEDADGNPLAVGRRRCSRLGLDLDPDAGTCRWGGENLDLYCATAGLWGLDHRPQPHQAA